MKIPLNKIEDMLEQAGYALANQDEGNNLWYTWYQNCSATARAICIVTSKDSPTWYELLGGISTEVRHQSQLWDHINRPIYMV